MTIVAAKRCGDRIVVMSDTMISDSNLTRNNILPGRLKTVVVNKWLTISYAGLSTQAIDAVRTIYTNPGTTTETALKYLLEVSCRHRSKLDFLVCSHEFETRLCKISNGKLFEGAKTYWIGSSEAASELSRIKVSADGFDAPFGHISSEEVEFKNAFHDFMGHNNCEEIGGAIVDCLCSPKGHCYNSHAGVFSWEAITLGAESPGEQEERKRRNKTGISYYQYHVLSPSVRGQGIVGFYLSQARTGFIYDPLHYDEAMRVYSVGLKEFSDLIDYAGKALARKHG